MACYGNLRVMRIERNEQSVYQAISFRVNMVHDEWDAVSDGGGGDADDSGPVFPPHIKSLIR